MPIKRPKIAKAALVVAVWGIGHTHVQIANAQTRALGLDCSFSQLAWQSAANAGYQFGWAESTNGSTTRTAFAFNITSAPTATFIYNGTVTHFLIGAYHFDHPDLQSSGMTPAQDAGYFLDAAGPYMTAGHVLPILDQEVTAMGGLNDSQYAQQFSDIIYAAKGIRPLFYSNESHAALLSASAAATMAGLWIGRPTFTDADAQTGNPDEAVANPYGGFGSYASQPWNAWQYTKSTSTAFGTIDKDVAHGDLDYLRDFTIPALWLSGVSGSWNTTSNWNTKNLSSSAATLPGSIENVNVNLTSAAAGSISITLSSGIQNIRSLVNSYNLTISSTGKLAAAKEAILNSGETTTIAGGTLSANLLTISSGATLNQTSGAIAATDWVWLPTTFAGLIQNNGTLNLSGGAVTGPLINAGTLTAGTVSITGAVSHTATTAMVVSTGGTMTITGPLTLGHSTVTLTPSATSPAKMILNGDLTYNGSGNGATIASATAAGQSLGIFSLGNGTRTFTVNNGTGANDLQINAIVASGGIIKAGAGTMILNAPNTYASGTTVNAGIIQVAGTSPLSTGGVTVTETTVGSTFGGTVQMSGNAIVNLPLIISGAGASGASAVGPGTMGALDNLSGNSTWSGTVTLNGTGANAGDVLLNQIGSTAGSLYVSGVIANGTGTNLAKTGVGDVVFTGNSPNTFTGMTRVLGGRLIVEKDGAFGAAGSTTSTEGNVFQLSGASSTIALRAQGASPGFSYNTYEWLELEGTNSASGQLDNLGGANTFAGNIGIGGGNVGGSVQSYLGVTSGSLELSGQLTGRNSSGTSAVPRAITKLGAGTLILSGDSSGTVTNGSNVTLQNSSMSIAAGTVLLRGSFNTPGITSWIAKPGGTLALAKSGVTGAFTLAGGTLQTVIPMSISNPLSITASSTIDTAANNSTYVGSISSNFSVTKTGAGKLSATNIRTGGVILSAGTIEIAAGGGTAGTSRTSSLTNAGLLDLNDHSLIVDYSTSSPVASIRQMLINGHGPGDWSGTTGISSSIAHVDTNHHHTLAYGQATDLGITNFAGQTITGNAVVVKYTYYGDSNLDGVVDLDNDFALFVDGYNRQISNPASLNASNLWVNGDYNFDGMIDLDNDFSIFVDSYAAFTQNPTQLAQLDSIINSMDLTTAQKNVLLSSVPEPSVIGLSAAGFALLARRRRRPEFNLRKSA